MKICRFIGVLLLGEALSLSSRHLALAVALPSVSDQPPVPAAHFPDAAHAVVWRNWQLVEPARLAAVLGTSEEKVAELAGSMGLPHAVIVSREMRERGYITLVRRNWHLLPYDQLLQLLDMTADELAFRLREDDFLYAKLGGFKPRCEPVRYRETDANTQRREAEIRRLVREQFGERLGQPAEPRFSFVEEFNRAGSPAASAINRNGDDGLRFIYSYFAVFGDPLANPQLDPFPDGLLAQLRALGVNGI